MPQHRHRIARQSGQTNQLFYKYLDILHNYSLIVRILSQNTLPITSLRLTHSHAHTVLEGTALGIAQASLVDDGKSQFVTICRRTITGERRDTSHCTRLGMHITGRKGTLHAFFQRSVLTGNGQRGIELRKA